MIMKLVVTENDNTTKMLLDASILPEIVSYVQRKAFYSYCICILKETILMVFLLILMDFTGINIY